MEQIAMNNGFKTPVIEHEQKDSAPSTNGAHGEELTAQALEGIRGTERLSGFGRFATKMQNMFQTPQRSQSKSPAHLKAAPIMMSAGMLMLIATALLFVLSKPESSVPGHFHQPVGLAGTDDQKHANPGTNGSPDVTENQLVGGEETDAQRTNSGSQADSRTNEDASIRHMSVSGDGGGGGSTSPVQDASSELQSPATVFVASVSNSPINPFGAFQQQPGPQLPTGTEIVAHTTNAINSGLESPVVAVVDRSVELDDNVVIPQGARVIGYTAGAVKDRINIRFNSLLLPNNRSITISALALMRDGSAGLVGRVQGKGHPILSGAARVATGTAVMATQFVGQSSATLNQPFSESDYLRNEMAGVVADQGNRVSNHLQQPITMPIVMVNTNQSIRIFLLDPISISDGRVRSSNPAQQVDSVNANAEQNLPPEQALVTAQTAYIQALEAQLADMRAALDGRKSNGRQ
jgi:type F conjugative transfer system protein TrbI